MSNSRFPKISRLLLALAIGCFIGSEAAPTSTSPEMEFSESAEIPESPAAYSAKAMMNMLYPPGDLTADERSKLLKRGEEGEAEVTEAYGTKAEKAALKKAAPTREAMAAMAVAHEDSQDKAAYNNPSEGRKQLEDSRKSSHKKKEEEEKEGEFEIQVEQGADARTMTKEHAAARARVATSLKSVLKKASGMLGAFVPGSTSGSLTNFGTSRHALRKLFRQAKKQFGWIQFTAAKAFVKAVGTKWWWSKTCAQANVQDAANEVECKAIASVRGASYWGVRHWRGSPQGCVWFKGSRWNRRGAYWNPRGNRRSAKSNRYQSSALVSYCMNSLENKLGLRSQGAAMAEDLTASLMQQPQSSSSQGSKTPEKPPKTTLQEEESSAGASCSTGGWAGGLWVRLAGSWGLAAAGATFNFNLAPAIKHGFDQCPVPVGAGVTGLRYFASVPPGSMVCKGGQLMLGAGAFVAYNIPAQFKKTYKNAAMYTPSITTIDVGYQNAFFRKKHIVLNARLALWPHGKFALHVGAMVKLFPIRKKCEGRIGPVFPHIPPESHSFKISTGRSFPLGIIRQL